MDWGVLGRYEATILLKRSGWTEPKSKRIYPLIKSRSLFVKWVFLFEESMKLIDENGKKRDAFITEEEVVWIYHYVSLQLDRDMTDEESEFLGYAVRAYDEVLNKRKKN